MVSVLLTSYKEPKSVGRAIQSIADSTYSGYKKKLEIIQISPDTETLEAGKHTADKYPYIEYIQIKDPKQGKPAALNLGLQKASGDIIIFTDGDVYFGKNAVRYLIDKFKEDENIGGVSGRPISSDARNSIMGYYGHLFADANHYRRRIDLEEAPQEKSKIFVKKHRFFPLSGYIMAVKKNLIDFNLPPDVLVDDAYVSYQIFNKGYKLAYEPQAYCYIKYPNTLNDYFKQKKRSTGGYIQLWEYGIVSEDTKSRSPWHELELFWFPFKYASSIKEFLWSVLLIPIRALLWGQIIWDQKIRKKNFDEVWVRVESTK